MVPPFKEAVEACFVEGLTKVVFATETLAMGINMPARSVVIERLTKFTGERREMLTPGEYTQLTGRAGRRGIDDLGFAIVLWSPFVPFEQVAALASSRTYALRSAFRPTYNMAANLVRRYEPDEAHHLLNLSFAQFQADRAVVRIESRIERQRQRLSRLQHEATCDLGDLAEYRALRQAADEARRARPSDRLDPVEEALAALSPGDVVVLDGVRHAVLSVAYRKGNPKLHVIDERSVPRNLAAHELAEPPHATGQIDLPVPYNPNDRGFQHQVADRLRRRRLPPAKAPRPRSSADAHQPDAADEALTAAMAHPVADCPDRDAHLRAAVQSDRVQRELDDLRRQVRGRTESLARRFDRVLRLLEAWGYLDGWSLTESGTVLARTYHEADLLVAEAMTSGLLDDLDAPSLAALVSCVTYEHRGRDRPPEPRFPSSTVRERYRELTRVATAIVADEEEAGLPPTRLPDAGFVHLAHAWASGEDLSELLEDELLSGGDFVRNVKTLIDLLRGIGDVAPVSATAARARQAADALHRGVVSASSALDRADRPPEPGRPDQPEGTGDDRAG
jgi:ATP-dependent RNA helicase HelY